MRGSIKPPYVVSKTITYEKPYLQITIPLITYQNQKVNGEVCNNHQHYQQNSCKNNNQKNSLFLRDEFISYILVTYILVLTANFKQFFAFYLQNEGSVMSKIAHFLHLAVFSRVSAIMKGDDIYNEWRNE